MSDQRTERLAQLKQCPVVEVLGVVSPTGSSGGRYADGEWTLRFSFDVWKKAGGEINRRGLVIQKEVSHDELKAFMAQIKAFDVLRVRAQVAEQDGASPQGLLVEQIGKDSDIALHEHAKELQKPVTFQDPRLGLFTLDRRINWFESEVAWGSKKIRLTLSLGDDDDVKELLAAAHALWDAQPTWDKRMADFAVSQLLDLKNDTWLGDDEEEFTSDQFKNKMALETISINSRDNIEFWYNDGDLFWGHSIRVSGTLSTGPDDAGIEG